MQLYKLKGRDGVSYPCTHFEEEGYYFLDTSKAYYVTHHKDEDGNLVGIDPEGLYVISIGHTFIDTNKKITKIEPTENGYNIHVNY